MTCPNDVFEDPRLEDVPLTVVAGFALIMLAADDHMLFEGCRRLQLVPAWSLDPRRNDDVSPFGPKWLLTAGQGRESKQGEHGTHGSSGGGMSRAKGVVMTPESLEQMRELLRSLAAAQSLDLDDRLAALEERIVGRIAAAVVDELDRRGWTVAAPTTEAKRGRS